MDTQIQNTTDNLTLDENALKQVIIPPDIKIFLERILEEADLLLLDDETYNTILKSMYLQLDQHLLGRILEALPEDKLEGFIALDAAEKTSNPQAVQDYLEKNLPQAKDIFAKAFEDFKTMYLESIAQEKAKEETNIQDSDTNKIGQVLSEIALGNIQSNKIE